MKQRHRKHKLNAARRKDVRSPWVRTSEYFAVCHSVRDWFAELSAPVDNASEHKLTAGEIGTVVGYRFVASPKVKA